MRLDICIPTRESAGVIGPTMRHLRQAANNSSAIINCVRVEDASPTDETVTRIRDQAEALGLQVDAVQASRSLPAARERLIDRTETDWFLFLDDDVRVGEDYLRTLLSWTGSPRVGAVQGRKLSRDEHPTDWHRRRGRRGGTHATLIRTAAARGVSIPADVEVLEDEYLRRCIESEDYQWIQDAGARFEHDCQNRHPIGWTEGRVAGTYRLAPFHQLALNVPFSLASGRNPVPHAKRAAGWLAGRLQSKSGPAPTETLAADGGREQNR